MISWHRLSLLLAACVIYPCDGLNYGMVNKNLSPQVERRCFLGGLAAAAALPAAAVAKCADIESCREIGDRKIEETALLNPTTKLEGGVRYKVLKPGAGVETVGPDATIDIIFSISQAAGAYMYSTGFGFEKTADGRTTDELESYRVQLGALDVPLGIERALVGMQRGERRRVLLPPAVGFVTSEWRPAPTTRRGKATVVGYRRVLDGRGSAQPPFPAETVWDIELVRIRK